uniref:Uncharacterized protein n=1 Tax=Anguilla anguilla TaxID=7936 RepID=A0A0E9PR01_ANGAN
MELKKQQHGGVGLYFKNDADCNITHLPCLNIECLTFSIKSLEANVAILYRPPSYSLVTFRTKLLHLIHHLDTFLGTKIIMATSMKISSLHKLFKISCSNMDTPNLLNKQLLKRPP